MVGGKAIPNPFDFAQGSASLEAATHLSSVHKFACYKIQLSVRVSAACFRSCHVRNFLFY
jgi:hypothetical protein